MVLACFSPLKGYRGPQGGFVASAAKSPTRVRMSVPCGGCMGCRIAKSRDWAVRIAHEAAQHEENAFLTLTYADAHLPEDFSVSVREMQLFLKRLRKTISPKRIRFYACGEYGERTLRPHYHVIVFGYWPSDALPFKRTPAGSIVHVSAELSTVWPFGSAHVGRVTAESGGYVARYCTKKIGGAAAPGHYRRVHPLTGQECEVAPEFGVMSTRPGIGRVWFEQWEEDVKTNDFVVHQGKKYPIPKYYRERLRGRFAYGGDAEALVVEDDWRKHRLSAQKEMRRLEAAGELAPERLAVREELTRLNAERFKRDFED